MGGRACGQQGRRTLVVLNDHAVRPSRLRSSTASRTARRAGRASPLQPVQVNGNGDYQRILFHSVRTASADRVREMGPPRAATLRWCASCTKPGATHSTRPSTCTAKLLDRNRKLVEGRLDDMRKAQRQAVDRIVQHYRRLGAAACRPMCRSTSRRRRCSRSSAVMA